MRYLPDKTFEEEIEKLYEEIKESEFWEKANLKNYNKESGMIETDEYIQTMWGFYTEGINNTWEKRCNSIFKVLDFLEKIDENKSNLYRKIVESEKLAIDKIVRLDKEKIELRGENSNLLIETLGFKLERSSKELEKIQNKREKLSSTLLILETKIETYGEIYNILCENMKRNILNILKEYIDSLEN